MTWRSNTAATTSNWITSRYDGLGVPVSDIPSTGDSGAGYLFNDIAAQGAVSTDEMRGVILTSPSVGTFTTYENSSFSFTDAPDGVYTATYRGFRNGVTYGDYTITMTIGGSDVSATVNAGLPVPIASASATVTAQSVTASIVAGLPVPIAQASASSSALSVVATISAGLPALTASASASVVVNVSATIAAGLPVPTALAQAVNASNVTMTISAGLPVPTSTVYAINGERIIFVPADNMATLLQLSSTTYL